MSDTIIQTQPFIINSALPRIALVGNPNCGKTALFNALTGGRQKVANYAGVTVEKKEGVFIGHSGHKIRVLDLPGTYSLRARSPDEEITKKVILGQLGQEAHIDAFVCVADATNLHLGLRLVLELKKVGKPVLLALNMHDVAKRRGYDVDINLLSQELGIPVVPTVAIKKNGIKDLVTTIDDKLFNNPQKQAINNNSEGIFTNSSSEWHEPNAHEVRAYHKEVERILCVSQRKQGHASEFTKKLDQLLLHPVLGIIALLLILFVVFQAVFAWAEYPKDLLQGLFDSAQGWVNTSLPEGVLRGLITNGIIAGVGSVVVFIPQILALFFFILLLEDSGYMARAAFLMDKLMGGAGLHGRAFIPMLSGVACAIPAIMATRTIENRKDRLITTMVIPLMTCSARIPVFTIIIGAFIPSIKLGGVVGLQGFVMFALYAIGIISSLVVAFILKKFFLKGTKEPLLMELPTYKIPSIKNIIIGLIERANIFLKKAGTIILAVMIIIWFLCTYPTAPIGTIAPAINYSFAGMIGHFFEPLLMPIGFNWQIATALIPGMAAREVAVATLGTIYAVSGSEDTMTQNLSTVLAHSWSIPTALSFLTWYIFSPQCASTLAITKRETNSWKWPIIMFLYMLGLAYLSSFIVFNLASRII